MCEKFVIFGGVKNEVNLMCDYVWYKELLRWFLCFDLIRISGVFVVFLVFLVSRNFIGEGDDV